MSFSSLVLLAALPQAPLDHLLPPDSTTNSQVGQSVVIAGEWVAIGARFDPMVAPGAGAVDLYRNTPAGLEHSGRLLAPDGAAGDAFGFAMSMDGDVLAVGAPMATTSVATAGALYLFERTPGGFAFLQKLTPTVPLEGERLGETVLVSGEWIFGGMHIGDDVPPHPGRGHVFRRVEGVWQVHQVLVPSDGADGDHFGFAYGLTPDGDELFVGARNDNDAGPTAGSVYRFTLNGGQWVEQGKFYAPTPSPGAYFGAGFAFADADTMFVAAPIHDTAAVGGGAVFRFQRDAAGTWHAAGTLAPSLPVHGANFGQSFAVRTPWLVVGAPRDTLGVGTPGLLWLFERSEDGTWVERGRLAPPPFDGQPLPGAADPGLFGWSVALDAPSAAGPGLIIGGAPAASPVSVRSGYATAFAHPEHRALGFIAGPQALALHEGHDVVMELFGGGPANPVPGAGTGTSAAPSLAGTVYAVLGSATGTAPALPLAPGVHLALVPDAYTTATIVYAGVAPFLDTLGFIGADARATATLAVPGRSAPGLAGTTLWHAAVAIDLVGGTVLAASAPRPLFLAP